MAQLERERALLAPPQVIRAAHNLAGAWPKNATVTVVHGALVEVTASGTAYTGTIGLTGIPFLWDGVEVARTHLMINEVLIHRTFPTTFFLVEDVTPGVHTITVNTVAGVGGTSDLNDFAHILVRDYARVTS